MSLDAKCRNLAREIELLENNPGYGGGEYEKHRHTADLKRRLSAAEIRRDLPGLCRDRL